MRRALLLLPLLAGCAVRDTGTLPPPPVAATFPFAPPAATPATPAARDIAWDRFFTDPRLQRLIALSLDNNRDLAAAVARIAEARAQAGLARAGRFPTLRAGATLRLGDRAGGGGTGGTGESGGTVNPQPGAGDDFDGGTGGAGGGGRYNLQLSLAAYELDFWGRIAALDAAARANYLGRLEAARAFRVSLIRDVAESYIAERDLDERIALAEAALRARREALRLANLRADAGEATRIDLRQSELLVTQAATALAVLRRARAENANLLALLVGAPIPPACPRRARSPPSRSRRSRPASPRKSCSPVRTSLPPRPTCAPAAPTSPQPAPPSCRASPSRAAPASRRKASATCSTASSGASSRACCNPSSTAAATAPTGTSPRPARTSPSPPTNAASRSPSAKSPTRSPPAGSSPIASPPNNRPSPRRRNAPACPAAATRKASPASSKCSTQSASCSPPARRCWKRAATSSSPPPASTPRSAAARKPDRLARRLRAA